MSRAKKTAKIQVAKRRVRKPIGRKSKALVSFKSAGWYAAAARSFGLSIGEDAIRRDLARK